MYIDLHQKVVASVIGVLFVVGAFVLATWWLALVVFFVMAPFFLKVLTA
ncbi:hypothetical protein [Natrinema versiforme]|uniref:Uncharacterized protein n=1 Tax=Natrinema versiforme JCM 10478 TaxID=1227496 RepID=L9XTQ6_9EURY|nr:hypothetical protein [Natrinema versiforme]ELY64932.1 hypothetical protein C489_15996 [Natrinema versiforme JCM 10478]